MIHPPASLCMNFGYRFVLVNSLLIIFFVKFVLPTKHLIPISSLQLFLFILRGLYFEAESFSLSFPLFYSITTIHILCDCHVLYTFQSHIRDQSVRWWIRRVTPNIIHCERSIFRILMQSLAHTVVFKCILFYLYSFFSYYSFKYSIE